MLRTRVLTALVLASVLIPAIWFLDRFAWSLVTALVAGLAGWEFARLAGFCSTGQTRYGIMLFAVCLVITVGLDSLTERRLHQGLTIVSAAFWMSVAPAWLWTRRKIESHLVLALVGLVIVLPTWGALVVIRDLGPAWLFAAILFIALADISAYFAGRAFGKRKLAPSISPGKSWEGVWGAMAVGVTSVFLYFAVAGVAFAPMAVFGVVISVPLIVLLSVEGDLLESLLKRQAGQKDSSHLLPGHGGVLDRIDSHTAALPMIALILTVFIEGR